MENEQGVMQDEYFDEVDLGNGIRQPKGILSVRWPSGVWLKLRYTWAYHLTIERDQTRFKHQIFQKEEDQILCYLKA